MEFIAEAEVTAGSPTSLSITGIPSDYRNLEFVFLLRNDSTGDNQALLTFNNVTTASYYWGHIYRTSPFDGPYFFATNEGSIPVRVADDTNPANVFAPSRVQMPNANSSDRKALTMNTARPKPGQNFGQRPYQIASRVEIFSPITTVTITQPVGLKVGSKIYVYGTRSE